MTFPGSESKYYPEEKPANWFINWLLNDWKILLALLAVFFFGIVWNTIGTFYETNDDLIIALSDYSFWTNTAITQGRIGHYIVGLLAGVPHLFHSFLYYKGMQIVAITMFVISFSSLAGVLFRNRYFAYILAALLSTLWQNSIGGHNMLVSFPFYFLFYNTLFALSCIALIRYIRVPGLSPLLLSLIPWCVVLGGREFWIVYLPLLFVFTYLETAHNERTFKFRPLAGILKWHILAVLVSYAFYIGFRLMYPSLHDGNTQLSFNVIKIAKTLIIYASGLFPGIQLIHNRNNLSLTDAWNTEGIIVSVTLLFLLLFNRERIQLLTGNVKRILLVIFTMVYAVFAPVLLISLTAKYQNLVELGTSNYVYSAYSFFAIIFFFLIVFSVLSKWRNWYIAASISVVALSYGIQINNAVVAKWQSHDTIRWTLFNAFARDAAMAELKENDTVSAPSLWFYNLYQEDYWTRYLKMISGRNIEVVNNMKSANRLIFIEGSQFGKGRLLFAKDSLLRSVYLPRGDYNNKEPVYLLTRASVFGENLVDNTRVGIDKTGTIKSTLLKPFQPSARASVIGIKERIPLRDFIALTDYNPGILFSPVVEYAKGFYHLEVYNDFMLRWASGDGRIVIHSTSNSQVRLELYMAAATEGNIKLMLNGNEATAVFHDSAIQKVTFNATLFEGSNILSLQSNIAPLPRRLGDPRTYAWRLEGFFIHEVESPVADPAGT